MNVDRPQCRVPDLLGRARGDHADAVAEGVDPTKRLAPQYSVTTSWCGVGRRPPGPAAPARLLHLDLAGDVPTDVRMDAVGADHEIEPSEACRTGQHLDFIAMVDDTGDGGPHLQRQIGGRLTQHLQQVTARQLANHAEASDRLGKVECLNALAPAIAKRVGVHRLTAPDKMIVSQSVV